MHHVGEGLAKVTRQFSSVSLFVLNPDLGRAGWAWIAAATLGLSCAIRQCSALIEVGAAVELTDYPHVCLATREAVHRAAEATEAFFRIGTPLGTLIDHENSDRRQQAVSILAGASRWLMELDMEEIRTSKEPCAMALGERSSRYIGLIQSLFGILSDPRGMWQKSDDPVAYAALEEAVILLGVGWPMWTEAVLSGWPIFRLAWVVDEQMRDPLEPNRLWVMMYAEDGPGCEEMEAFRSYAIVLSGEGRVSMLAEVLKGYPAPAPVRNDSVVHLIQDLLETEVTCPASAAVVLVMIADALQCYWRRPQACGIQLLLRRLIQGVQAHTYHALFPSDADDSAGFGKAELEMHNWDASMKRAQRLLRWPWPMMRLLSRLNVSQVVPGVQVGELCAGESKAAAASVLDAGEASPSSSDSHAQWQMAEGRQPKRPMTFAVAWTIGDHVEGTYFGISLNEATKLFSDHKEIVGSDEIFTATMLGRSDGQEVAFAGSREAGGRLQAWFAKLWSHSPTSDQPVLVSWSSREAEMGGMNWAARFAATVFGDRPGIVLAEDNHVADIFIFRAIMPYNVGGVLLFVDGETQPADGGKPLHRLIQEYPLSMVVGPVAAVPNNTDRSAIPHIMVPYVSTSFASRKRHSPVDLSTSPRAPPPEGLKRHFAAYMAVNCVKHREDFFEMLQHASLWYGLGSVDALSRCGNRNVTNATLDKIMEARRSKSYFDDAVEKYLPYRFALVFENKLSQNYVTEKIANAYLAGAIPIYWGSPLALEIFNPASFIYVNHYPSMEAAVQAVVAISTSPALYNAYVTAPILRDTRTAKHIFSWHADAIEAWLPVEHRPTALQEQIMEVAMSLHIEGLSLAHPEKMKEMEESLLVALTPHEMRALEYAPLLFS